MTQFQSVLSVLDCSSTDNLLASLRQATKHPLPVGSDHVREFTTELSQRLLADPRARKYPELQALGFWLRPAAIGEMIRVRLVSYAETRRVPAGVVFQLPPSNVSTLFGYTVAIGLLCGNVVVVRLSSKPTTEQEVLVTLINKILTEVTPNLRDYLYLLRFDHDDSVTGALSAVVDVRMVWGSDQTVEHIRRISLPPLSRHISFGNRYSAVAIKGAYYEAASEEQKEDLTRKLFNDIYWFDQMACSSPRFILWVGENTNLDGVTADFYPRLANYASVHGYRPEASGCIAKLSTSFLALHDLNASSSRRYGPSLTVVTLDNFEGFSSFKQESSGFGMLLEGRSTDLNALAELAERCDQTLGVWGFESTEIEAFAKRCGGRGYDRIVGVGNALRFDPIWDGINLFDAMSRFVLIRP